MNKKIITTKIVAIGGGEIGRTKTMQDGTVKQYPVQTLEIDKRIIALTEKDNPNFLLIHTASSDSVAYEETVQKYFGDTLKCNLDYLRLIRENLSHSEIENKVMNTDIVYVGGGDSMKMMQIWKEHNLLEILTHAYKHGVVMSGLSAGAMCWFNSCEHYDDGKEFDSLNCSALGFINGYCIPHWNKYKTLYKNYYIKFLKNRYIIALDECAAIEVIDDNFKIIKSAPDANAYFIKIDNDKLIENKIEIAPEYQPISCLYRRYNQWN